MWYDTLLYRVQLGGRQGKPGHQQSVQNDVSTEARQGKTASTKHTLSPITTVPRCSIEDDLE
jgi:hypothetical protein